MLCVVVCFLFQAEDGIRDLVRSRGLGDVYKRQLIRYSSASGNTVVCPYSALSPDAGFLPGSRHIPYLSLIHI